MDRGAWWATVHRVAKSQIPLSIHEHTHTHTHTHRGGTKGGPSAYICTFTLYLGPEGEQGHSYQLSTCLAPGNLCILLCVSTTLCMKRNRLDLKSLCYKTRKWLSLDWTELYLGNSKALACSIFPPRLNSRSCCTPASLYAHPDPAGPSASYHDRGERYEVGIKPSLHPGNTLNACFSLPSAWSRSSFQAYSSPVNLVQNRCMWGRKWRSFQLRVSYFSSQRAQSLWFAFVLFMSTIRVSSPSRWGKKAGPGICIQWLLSATSGPLCHLFRPRSSYSHILQELP